MSCENPNLVKQFWVNIAKYIDVKEPTIYHESYQCQTIKSNWFFQGCLSKNKTPEKTDFCDQLAQEYSACVLKHELYKVIQNPSV